MSGAEWPGPRGGVRLRGAVPFTVAGGRVAALAVLAGTAGVRRERQGTGRGCTFGSGSLVARMRSPG